VIVNGRVGEDAESTPACVPVRLDTAYCFPVWEGAVSTAMTYAGVTNPVSAPPVMGDVREKDIEFTPRVYEKRLPTILKILGENAAIILTHGVDEVGIVKTNDGTNCAGDRMKRFPVLTEKVALPPKLSVA